MTVCSCSLYFFGVTRLHFFWNANLTNLVTLFVMLCVLQCLKRREQDTNHRALNRPSALVVSDMAPGGHQSAISGVLVDDQTQMITPSTIATTLMRTPSVQTTPSTPH